LTVLAVSFFDVFWLGMPLLACIFLFFGLVEIVFATGGILYRLRWRGPGESPLPTLEPPGPAQVDRAAVRAPIRLPRDHPPPEPLSPEELQKNKRGARRRATLKIPVEILLAGAQGEPLKGWVLDRSNSGMRLEIPGKIEIGTILQVRNADHARSAPWVQVEVRNCVVKANQWRAGCRFTHPQPAEVLLFFG
jgi:PilZ domain